MKQNEQYREIGPTFWSNRSCVSVLSIFYIPHPVYIQNFPAIKFGNVTEAPNFLLVAPPPYISSNRKQASWSQLHNCDLSRQNELWGGRCMTDPNYKYYQHIKRLHIQEDNKYLLHTNSMYIFLRVSARLQLRGEDATVKILCVWC
jgi:hypothetical protein